MATDYLSSVDYLAQKRYSEKLQIEGVSLPDPYELADEVWSDDMSLWPDLQYGDIYNYLIESKGQYTATSLKAFKSLEAFNYFFNGHVRTIYCYRFEHFAIMKAKVNPSQKSPDEAHTAWVILHQATAEVKAGHCDCKAGLGEVCSHVAAILFKVDAAVKLGLNKPSCTSQRCQWNNSFKENVNPSEVVNITFVKPMHPTKRKVLTPVQPSSKSPRTAEYKAKITEECLYKSIFKVNPTACLFTIVPEPELASTIITPPLSIMDRQISSQQDDSTSQITDNTAKQSTNVSAPQISEITTTQGLVDSISLMTDETCTSTQVTDGTDQIPEDITAQDVDDNISLMTGETSTQVTDGTDHILEDITMQGVDDNISLVTGETSAMAVQDTTRQQSTDRDNSTIIPIHTSKLIVDYFDSQYRKLDGATLLAKAKEIFVNMKVSNSECRQIEQSTKEQRECDDWFMYRKGRITASLFHDVFVLKAKTDPKNLISKLLDSSNLSQIPAVKWGIEHEAVAREQYVLAMNESHNNFKCHSSGLSINSNYPHLGASPDGLVECACCVGKGVVEIKCPFSGREYHPNQLHTIKNSFLNAKGLLNRSHRYFTQVQGQLMITGKEYCDFVVWTPVGVHVQRIYEEVPFTEKLLKKLTNFYVQYLLPAIMTGNVSAAGSQSELQDDRNSTSTIDGDDDDQVYCYCRREEYGKMIACDNQECKIGWFHFTCVGIKRVPRGQWFCRDCMQ